MRDAGHATDEPPAACLNLAKPEAFRTAAGRDRSTSQDLVIPVHLLTGPAHACPVDRELMFDLAPELRAYKPLWAWEDAFEAIDAMADAGAAVVQGEILVVPEGGPAMQLSWEPWLPEPCMQVTPRTRQWWCPRKEDEAWEAFVARAAAYAREWALALVGAARATPEGAVHVDLAWATRDELALFDVPGGIQRARRRQVEQGGGPGAWMYGFSIRPRSIGEPAPGSYFGDISSDLAEIPGDARYASFSSDGENLDRLADLTSLEVLDVGASSPQARALLARLPRLREVFMNDIDMSSVEWLGALSNLEFAYVSAGPRLRDPRPLSERCGRTAGPVRVCRMHPADQPARARGERGFARPAGRAGQPALSERMDEAGARRLSGAAGAAAQAARARHLARVVFPGGARVAGGGASGRPGAAPVAVPDPGGRVVEREVQAVWPQGRPGHRRQAAARAVPRLQSERDPEAREPLGDPALRRRGRARAFIRRVMSP